MGMTNAERQQRYRDRHNAGEPVRTFQRPRDRRARPPRWADALDQHPERAGEGELVRFPPPAPPLEPNQSVARERARPASGGPPANGRVARRGRAPLAAEALRLTESPIIRPRRGLHTTIVEELAVLVGQHHQQGALERFSGAANNIRRILVFSPSSALTRSLPSSRSRPCGRLDGLWVDWTSRTEGESQPYRQTVYHTLNHSSPAGGRRAGCRPVWSNGRGQGGTGRRAADRRAARPASRPRLSWLRRGRARRGPSAVWSCKARFHASDHPAAAGLMARAYLRARPKENGIALKFKW